jgi:hypothetical protein
MAIEDEGSAEEGDNTSQNSRQPSGQPKRRWAILNTIIARISPSQKQHETKEEAFWERQLRASKLLNVITATGTVAACGGLIILYATLQESHDATVEANRAWIAVPFVSHEPLQRGQPVRLQARIVNVGREPALGGVWRFNIYAAPYIPELAGNTRSPDLGQNTMCSSLVPVKGNNGMAVFPVADNKYWIPYASNPDRQSSVDAAIDQAESLILDGCFAYWAGNSAHHTAFRFFLRDVRGTSNVQWGFNLATSGNFAD